MHRSSKTRAGARGPRWPVASLRAYLTLVILVATVPLATFALVLLEGELAKARDERQAALYRSADSLAVMVEREVDTSTQALQVLSTDPALQQLDFPAFATAMSRWAAAHPAWRAVYLADAAGHDIVMTPHDAASPTAAEPRIELALAVGDRNLRLGAIAAPTYWQQLVSRVSGPPQAFLSLSDSSGRVMAASREPERLVGQRLEPQRQAHLLAHTGSDVSDSIALAWRHQPLVVTRQVARTQWLIAAGRVGPRGWGGIELLSSAFLAGLASLGLGLLLAHTVARRVSKPLMALAAGRPAEGAVVVHEIAALRDALAQAEAQRAQAMQALQQKADEFEAVFQASPVGLAMTQDTQSPLALINPALAQLLACSPGPVNLAERLAQGDLQLLRDDQPLDWRSLFLAANVATSAGLHDCELDIVSRDGRRRSAVVHAVPLRDEQGQVRGAIAAFTDISERKQLERERQGLMLREQAARQAAEAANRGKDEFLAMLGHELRNPLSAITAAVEVINRVGPHEDAAQSARRIIGRQTQQLVGLMNDLTDIARISAGKARLSRQRINLALLVWRTHAALRVAGRFRAQTLTLRLHETWVDVDPMRIEQVVSNLLTNATKYTPLHGHIVVSLHACDGEAELSVSDDGIGMSPALVERVFDLFVQGDRSPQGSQGGLGLGLALVRRLVELHGGRVQAESGGLNCGSRFTVRLPDATDAAPANAPAPRPLVVVGASAEALRAVESLIDEPACDVTLVPEVNGVEPCLRALASRQPVLLVEAAAVDAATIAQWKAMAPGVRVGAWLAAGGDVQWAESGFDRTLSPPLHLHELLA